MSSALAAFADLMQQDDARIDLAHACLMIAQDAYPGLQVERYLGDIERLALRLRSRTPQTASPEERVAALNEFLFGEVGLRGNTEAYYDPRNSFLNDVLERRLGIPITLSVLYMAVGRKLGLQVEGIGFPGHFLVRVRDPERGSTLVDAFAQGRMVTEEDLARILSRVSGREAPVPPSYLAPSSTRDVLSRMLGNLRGIYAGRGDAMKTLEVMEWLVLTRPENVELRRDRGLLYFRLGCTSAAAHDLKCYLLGEPAARDRAAIEHLLEKLGRTEAVLN